MMKNFNSCIKTEPNLEVVQDLPNKQEWGIINRYKALQFQQIKQREKMMDRQKKQAFRKQLNNQLSNRINTEQKEKQKDKLFYQQLNQKTEQLKRKQDEDKYQKLINCRMIEEENIHKIERVKGSRIVDNDTGYHLDIGVKSEHEHRAKSQFIKKEMVDTLDIQLREKSESIRQGKLHNQYLQKMHNQVQDNYFRSADKKIYSQNQKIYDLYEQLEKERNSREKEIEDKHIYKARQNRIRAQEQRARLQEQQKLQENSKVKEALDQQIKQLNKRRQDQKTINPEDISYRFISNMFRPKEQVFDPKKYKRDLQLQAEQQKKRRATENYMSEEEYRLNMNQLSKAVIGSYTRENYLDRSLAAIGDNKEYKLDYLKLNLKDNDTDIIKRKLQNLRIRESSSRH